MQIDDLDASFCDRGEEGRRDDVHPASADDEVRAWTESEEDLREVGVILCACGSDAFGGGLAVAVLRRRVLVLDEVVVRPWYPCFVGAVEAFNAFTAAVMSVGVSLKRREGMCTLRLHV